MELRPNAKRGFTLIEMLVAVAISALIALLAYGFLSSAITAKEGTADALERVNELETTFYLIATDLHHVVDRNLPSAEVGLGSTGPAPAFIGGASSARGANVLLGDYVLRFVRDGWANPLGLQRSDLQRVGYRWFDGQLWRDFWAERNQALDAEPAGARLLIEDLQALQIRFLPPGAEELAGADWEEVWPPQNLTVSPQGGQSQLPLAVEITLTLEEVGDVQRIFTLPGV